MNDRLVTELADLASGVANQLNLELVDVELVKEGGAHYLRFYIDKPGGVFLDDCEAFHRRIEPLLDERDPIPHAYNLEVASPGANRPLKKDVDFERFAGQRVQVRCYEPWNGRRQWHGKLIGLLGDDLVIVADEGEQRIPRAKVSRTRLDPEF
ncbi:MAG: ribosome maturation factor RimP [Chloroflexota bacterium]